MRTIAFIGVGNMAGAIIQGMLKSGMVDHSHLVLCDTLTEKCLPYVACGAMLVETPADAAKLADCIVLSVKPQNFPEILPLLADVPQIKEKLIITIAAGITVNTVKSALSGAPVVRVLPNTPMLIGLGVSVICRAPDVDPMGFALVCDMFAASGRIQLIDEAEMNRMIGVTSSSPAYVFAFIDAMWQGAKAQGLQDPAILPCICDTLIGAATLLKNGSLTPDEQIHVVASKGGTTEQAIRVLRENDLYGMMREAMQACTDRAEELARGTSSKQ